MIKNAGLLRKFERNLVRAEKPDYSQNVRIAEALRREAVALEVLPPKNPLEGIEVKIRIAEAVNRVRTTPRPHRRRAR